MPYSTVIEKRDRAVVAFLALTGVRDAALISLKMKDIDHHKKEVWQDPKHVKTKNRKAISTFFMAFDPLWESIVMEWLDYAKQKCGLRPDDPLFPKTLVQSNPDTLSFEVVGLSREHWAGAAPIRDILKKGFAAAHLPYYHPHSFRKMLAHWAMEHCSQIQFKAISQNIGHEHCMTTYNAYGELNDQKRRTLITAIGDAPKTDISDVPHDMLMAELQRRMGG